MIFFIFIAYLVIIFLSLTVGFFCIQIFTGIIFRKKYTKHLDGDRKSVTVIIPAHNEELVIENTLTHLLPQMTNIDQVIVVADNCKDSTVDLANKFNVTVVERTHDTDRGKGFALDFGLTEAQKKPTEVVMIIDADCLVHDDLISQLAIAAYKYQRPIQALYLMLNNTDCSIKQKIAEFAFLIKNKVRPMGLKALNLPCQLMGTGMAFPWSLIQQADLANGNIVEDMKLGVDCVLDKKGAVFLPNVKVTSYFPTDVETLETQRTRWEHGHISTVLSFVPKLFINSIQKINIKAFFFALDLMILPLAFLALLIITSLLISVIFWFFSVFALIKIMAVIVPLFFSSIMIAWYFQARQIISFSELTNIPIYILSKLSIYKRLFGDKEKGWNKTKR